MSSCLDVTDSELSVGSFIPSILICHLVRDHSVCSSDFRSFVVQCYNSSDADNRIGFVLLM